MKHFPISLRLIALLGLLTYANVSKAQDVNLPPVVRNQEGNGVKMLLVESHRIPTLTVIAVFPGGSVQEATGKAGTASLTATLLTKGTEKRTAQQIAEEIDFLGGSLDASADSDRVTVSLDILAKDADAGLDLLSDVLRHATLPNEELERERQLRLASLQSIGEDPQAVARLVEQQTVFAGHPYGTATTQTTLKAITRDDLASYYKQFIAPDHMILVAVGDFKPAEMAEKLRARFGDWVKSGTALKAVASVPTGTVRHVLIDKPDATQTQVRFGRPAISRTSPDYYAAEVATSILGGGFTSRLVDEIRVNRSLTYGISSRFGTRQAGGSFGVSTFTKIETTRALLDATSDVLKKTADSGFTPAEIKKIQGFMVGQYAIELQTPQALAGQLADVAFFGLPENYLSTYLEKIRGVTREDANRIAKTYFTPEALSVILVAPASKVKTQLEGLPSFETRPLSTVGQ